MGCVLSLRMNDAAVATLGVLSGLVGVVPPGGLAAGLREIAAGGIVRRGEVLTWAGSTGDAAGAPSFFGDLTAWECSDSSFHLEDLVPVDVVIVDDAPVISGEGQRILLLHGVAFALEFSQRVYGLNPPSSVRCILGVNETNATFRFHQIRPGESWNVPDLDNYRLEMLVVIDIEPANGR
ncbi:hypothetical protein Aple_070600 [Acrocarpospora pleiomorpha]|uniref:Uncharacterized protein n=2 Tax=Acrocarpospora pleiomorpha TaxID=90975 RepID=A0A5M3XX73_9ACTN|nr:hypothetical protein Aple_070600 [Acrocarpospora pleiomorpha]